MKKVLFSLFVLAGFAACTSDDVVISDSTTKTFDGDEAYFTVNIRYADQASTRATDGGYEAGLEDEYAISRASFYFYDETGEYVSRAEIDRISGTEQTPVATTDGTDGNSTVEFQSDAVIVLKGLTEKSMPRYMVTVLNEPDGFESGSYAEYYEPAGTLTELYSKLAFGTGYDDGGTYNSSYSFNQNAGILDAYNYFVMSTTSFIGEEDHRAGQTPYFFATGVTDDDFYEEPVETDKATPIDVYVERLAAKVMVAANGSNTIDIDLTDGTTVSGYLVTASIAGDANQEDTSMDVDPNYGVGGNTWYAEGDEEIYIVLDGWKLNATARQSYIMKNIEPDWTFDWDSNGSWNDALNHRSYWGEAYLYGKQGDTTVTDSDIDHNGYPVSSKNEELTYPTTAGGEIDENQAANYDVDELNQSTWLNSYVKYTSLSGELNTIGEDYYGFSDAGIEYCAENTNTANILVDKNSSAITSALVRATGYTKNYVADDTTGEYSWDGTYSANTLISYKGMLFTEDAFIAKMTEDVSDYIDTWADDFYYTGTLQEGDVDYGEFRFSQLYYCEAQLAQSQEDYAGQRWTADQLAARGFSTLTPVISSSDFTWQSDGNGHISLAFNDSGYSDGAWLWRRLVVNGVTQYSLIRDSQFVAPGQEDVESQLAMVEAEIQDYVAALNTNDDIYAYVDGQMYYSVPIEHLDDSIERDSSGKQTNALVEAQYGVVRNHEYRIVVSDVTKLGKPIADDNEVIVPDPTDPTYYYLEAEVNVLGWRVLVQESSF